jgi:hypothetical protein
MVEYIGEDYEPFANLRSMAQSTFPKLCNNCCLNYQTSEQFLLATHSPGSDVTGLKVGHGEDGNSNVQLFRNCS